MKQFWTKWNDHMDEDDVYQYIRKDFDNDGYGRGGKRDYDDYHSNPESKLRVLANVYEKIEDFFQSQGKDVRQYMGERSRRGRGLTGR